MDALSSLDTLTKSARLWLIKKIAASLTKILRNGDIVFRLGGDEFGLFVKGAKSADHAKEILTRLFDEINKERLKEINEEQIQISAGVTFFLMGDEFSKVYERADRALYESKKIEGCSVYVI